MTSHMEAKGLRLIYAVHCNAIARSSSAASWEANYKEVVNAINAWMQFLTKLSSGRPPGMAEVSRLHDRMDSGGRVTHGAVTEELLSTNVESRHLTSD